MPKLTGKDLFVSYGGVALSAAQRSLEITETQETADSTAGADTYRNFINTVATVEASMELIMSNHTGGGSALLASLTLGGTGTLLWGPEGSATGKPKKAFMARLVDTSQTLKFDDVYVLKLKWMNAGTAMIFNGVTDLF